MNHAIITRIAVSPHPDPEVHSLAVGHVFGETLIVSKNTINGQLGVYFPCGLQLSEEFARVNDLVRRKDEDGNPAGGMFKENRRVKAMKLRGVESHGFWCPLSYLSHFGDISKLKDGDEIDCFNGVKVCQKYVSKRNIRHGNTRTKTPKRLEKSFPRHADTKQLRYNVSRLHGEIIITEKLHGTSQRVGRVSVERKLSWFEKLLSWCGVKIDPYEMQVLNGTRRVILSRSKTSGMRAEAAQIFIPHLEDNMVVYFEVVGYDGDKPIMPVHHTKKLKDKGFCKRFGESVVYSYGCPVGDFDVYVYRITRVFPSGEVFDLSWDEIVEKCSLWGVKHVPEIKRITVTNKEEEMEEINAMSDHLSLIGPHISEGVCVRINTSGWHVFKHKGFTFKVLEGIVQDDENYYDLEEES